MSYDDRKNYHHSTVVDKLESDFGYTDNPNVILWIVALTFLVAAIILIVACY